MAVAEFIAGLLLAFLTLRDVFETVVVPGESRGLLRVLRRVVRLGLPAARRKGPIGVGFAPAAMLAAFVIWLLLLALAFGLMTLALGDGFTPPVTGLGEAMYLASGAMNTMGTGMKQPSGAAAALSVGAGFCGLAVMTLAITYLLQVQNNVSQRDTGVLKICTAAGHPPSALVLLERNAAIEGHQELLRTLASGRDWCANVLQSHASHPSLIYFRSVGTGTGWPATLGTLADLGLILEWLVDDTDALAPAVLLRKEADAAARELLQLLRLEPEPVEVPAAQLETLCSRLAASGYALKRDADFAGYAAARKALAGRVRSLGLHLGAAEAPLVP